MKRTEMLNVATSIPFAVAAGLGIGLLASGLHGYGVLPDLGFQTELFATPGQPEQLAYNQTMLGSCVALISSLAGARLAAQKQ